MSMSPEEALRRLQSTELEMLAVFKEWANENNITWFVDSGTCLGAVRHGGFIPWDDDIDIGIPRNDYNHMLELSKKNFPKGYSIHTSEDEGFTSLFCKMYADGTEFSTEQTMESGCKQSIFLDLFPYDYLPENNNSQRTQERTCANCQRMMYLFHLKNITVPHSGIVGAIEKALCFIGHFVCRLVTNPNRLQHRFNEACHGEGKVSAKMNNLAFAGYVPPFNSDMLLPVSRLSFEGLEVPGPNKPERYLETMYGDWKRIPSPEERHTHMPKKIVFQDGSIYINS